jgi:hypothetical protein
VVLPALGLLLPLTFPLLALALLLALPVMMVTEQ